MELEDETLPVIIGRDLMSRLGIVVDGLLSEFPPLPATPTDVQLPRCTEAEDDRMDPALWPAAVKEAMARNQAIPKGAKCPLPQAVIHLPTPPGTTAFKRQFALPRDYQHVVDEQVATWLQQDTITLAPVDTSFNHPLFLVDKRDSSGESVGKRACLDPRALNILLPEDRFPLPLISEIIDSLAGARFIAVLDLKSAFHRLPVAEEDQHKTTFTWRGCQYMFKGCPFGIKSIPAKLQRVMRLAIAGIPGVAVYMDDLVIQALSKDTLTNSLVTVINKLTDLNLGLALSKCKLYCTRVNLLGFVVSGTTVAINQAKYANVASWPYPSSVKSLQHYIGMANYIRNHIPKMSEIMAPLTALVSTTNFKRDWSDQHSRAFDLLKAALLSPLVLHHADFSKPFSVATDASDVGLGAIMYQEGPGGTPLYVGLMSRSLSKAERNYSATKRELLGIVFALKVFGHTLGVNHFDLYTDHMALIYMHSQRELSSMLCGWFEVLASFNFTVKHCPGIDNFLPDKLSRLYETDRLPEPQVTLRQLTPRSVGPEVDLSISPTSRIAKEWRDSHLNPTVFATLAQAHGPFSVDAFASFTNKQMTPYWTKRADAFLRPWTGHLFIFPPWELLAQVGAKIKADVAQATVITPDWSSSPWYSLFVAMSAKAPTVLEQTPSLFLDTPNGKPLGVPPWRRTLAWHLDGRLGQNGGPTPLHQSASPHVRLIPQVTELRDPPVEDRGRLLQVTHQQGHFGPKAMVDKLRSLGWAWSTALREAATVVQDCVVCQAHQIQRKGFHPLTSITASLPMDHVAIDLAGPFPTSPTGMNYLFIMVDVATSFVWLRCVPNKSAAAIAEVLLSIFVDFGAPRVLQHDNGTEFSNAVLRDIAELLHVNQRFTTPYHPRANGVAERQVQIACRLLRKYRDQTTRPWNDFVPAVQVAMNQKVHSRKHRSAPFAVMFARALNTAEAAPEDASAFLTPPSDTEVADILHRAQYAHDIVFPAVAAGARGQAASMTAAHDQRASLVDFQPGSTVMTLARDPGKLDPRYAGPFTVVRRTQGGSYVLMDTAQNLAPRNYAPSQLKLISPPETPYILAVINHRDNPSRSYLIRWSSHPGKPDEWRPAAEISDLQLILKYLTSRRATPLEALGEDLPAPARVIRPPPIARFRLPSLPSPSATRPEHSQPRASPALTARKGLERRLRPRAPPGPSPAGIGKFRASFAGSRRGPRPPPRPWIHGLRLVLGH
jgi:transposase InsO family protein